MCIFHNHNIYNIVKEHVLDPSEHAQLKDCSESCRLQASMHASPGKQAGRCRQANRRCRKVLYMYRQAEVTRSGWPGHDSLGTTAAALFVLCFLFFCYCCCCCCSDSITITPHNLVCSTCFSILKHT